MSKSPVKIEPTTTTQCWLAKLGRMECIIKRIVIHTPNTSETWEAEAIIPAHMDDSIKQLMIETVKENYRE